MSDDELIRRGEETARSCKYVPRDAYLGRIDAWGLDVFEGSPQQWIDALAAEEERRNAH